MKEIKFRPLRVIKKTGKITVASYMQWRSIKTADYNQFSLVIDESYKMLNDDNFVYDHNGKQLFFYDYNPGKVPIYLKTSLEDYEPEWKTGNNFIIHHKGTIYSPEDWFTFRMDGTDCDGVPVFSHYNADYIVSDHTRRYDLFEPLTVGMVKMWFGWFLWQLDNCRLKVGS